MLFWGLEFQLDVSVSYLGSAWVLGWCDPKSFAMMWRMLCKSDCLGGKLLRGRTWNLVLGTTVFEVPMFWIREQVSYSYLEYTSLWGCCTEYQERWQRNGTRGEIDGAVFSITSVHIWLTPKCSYDERVWLTERTTVETTETNKQTAHNVCSSGIRGEASPKVTLGRLYSVLEGGLIEQVNYEIRVPRWGRRLSLGHQGVDKVRAARMMRFILAW